MVTPLSTAEAREAALSFFLPDALLMADIAAAVFCLSAFRTEPGEARFLPGPLPLDITFFDRLLDAAVVDMGLFTPLVVEVFVCLATPSFFFIPFTVFVLEVIGALGYMYGGGGG